MKKFGWTMAELLVALAVLVLLAGFCVFTQKPGMNKGKLFAYFAVRSLTKANIVIAEKTFSINGSTEKYNVGLGYDPKGVAGGEFDTFKASATDDTDIDWYCSQVADSLSLSGAPNCARDAAATVENIKFSNGITFQGLATEWVKPYSDAPYEFKNIVIDIDGLGKGPDKAWVDRFPMRVYRGFEKMEGIVMPVNCKNDKVWNESELRLVDVQASNPYCPSTNAQNYTIDNEVMTYDIYKTTSSEEDTKSTMVATGLSAFEADCAAYHGKGFYSESECNTAGVSLHSNCSDSEENTDCYTVLHRPSDGIPIFMRALIGEIDEDSM